MKQASSHNPSVRTIKSPGDVIAELLVKLQTEPEQDAELLNILEAHILTEHPTPEAVEQALNSIIQLAVTRSGASQHGQ